jgi:hypothetical protein
MPIIDKNQSFFDVSPKNARRQKMGQMLIENATKSEPVYGWGQALSKLLAAGAGAYTVDRAERDSEAERNQGYGEIMGAPEARENSTNPYTQQYRLLERMNEMDTNNDVRVAEAKRNSIYGNGQPMPQPNGQPQPQPPTDSGAYVPPNQPQLTGNPVTDEQILKSYGKKVGTQQADAPVQEKGREGLDNILISLSDRLAQLDKLGGSANYGTEQWLSNTEGEVFGVNTPFGGQDFIRMGGGSPEQDLRDNIQSDINDIKLAYQKASGLSAKNLDSNQEMKQFMKGLPNLLRGTETNQNRVADMSERFANSVAKAKIEEARKSGGSLQPSAAIDQMEMPNDVSSQNIPSPAMQGRPAPLAIPSFQLDKRSRLEELRRKKAGQ